MNYYIAIEEDLLGFHYVRVKADSAKAVRKLLEGQGRRIVQIQHWVQGWPDG